MLYQKRTPLSQRLEIVLISSRPELHSALSAVAHEKNAAVPSIGFATLQLYLGDNLPAPFQRKLRDLLETSKASTYAFLADTLVNHALKLPDTQAPKFFKTRPTSSADEKNFRVAVPLSFSEIYEEPENKGLNKTEVLTKYLGGVVLLNTVPEVLRPRIYAAIEDTRSTTYDYVSTVIQQQILEAIEK